MTDVRLDFRVPHPGGNPEPTPDGYWLFRPSRLLQVEESGDGPAYALLPDPFKVELVDGVATASFTPSGPDWCWIGEPLGMVGLDEDRFFSVPDAGVVLDFYGAAIHDVDPATLDPATPVSPAYQVLIDAADEKATNALALAVDAESNAATAVAGLEGKADSAELEQARTELATSISDALTVAAGKASPAEVASAVAQEASARSAAIEAIVGAGPETLNQLAELAAAIGDDPNFAVTVAQQIGAKADSSALATFSDAMTQAVGFLNTTLTAQGESLGLKADTTALNTEAAARVASVVQRRLDPWRFDSTRGRAARVALAKRATTPFDGVGVGASWMAGSGALATAARWWDLATGNMRSRWPTAGAAGGRGYRESYSFTPGYTTPFAYSVTTGANPGANVNFGLGRKTYIIKAGNTVTFTLAAGETGARVVYGKGPTGGNFSWQKNGGAATVVSANSAAAQSAFLDVVGAPGDVFVITATAASLYFQGAYFFGGDEAKGIRMWNGGTSGYRTADFIDATGWTYDTIGLIDPDLIVVDLGANDYSGGTVQTPVSVATYKANLATLAANWRSRCSKPPTILLQMFPQITTGSVTPLAPWADYRAAALEWAQADGQVGVWDVAPIFGSMVGTDTYGITAGDQAHPNPSGYGAIADQLPDILAAA